ncbi:MAG: UV DNA damage repair endonuclease UvsE [Candidatus Nezhaarchaeales archaeon]
MRIGLGFFCSTSDNKLSTNHKVKLHNLNEETLLRTFEKNLKDFIALLELSRRMNLAIFRLGSSFIPFASHPNFKLEWLEKLGEVLMKVSSVIRDYGIRITMHPGQYVVLSSPNEAVLNRSLAELKYHFWVLDTLGLGSESVVVIHVGGVYKDKRRVVKRLEEALKRNQWLIKRLALENDERHYTISEVIEMAEVLGVPAVFDYYHHMLNPSKFSVDRLIATCGDKIPEVHLSSAPKKTASLRRAWRLR